MLMNIWVKDKDNGTIHQVGTDVHDSLFLFEGTVEYYNMQNGCGTPHTYEFVPAPNDDDYVQVTPEQLMLNRKLLHKDACRYAKRFKRKKKFIEFLNKFGWFFGD